ncbi:MAG TPA: hypothetical protein VGB56_10295 [Flavisolibacter sp.]
MKNLLFKNKITAVPAASQNLPSLATCILMDLLGFISYGIPVLGELLDIVWAPVSALVFMKLFGFRKGFLGGLFNFVEEALPGLDFIPTFTITWFIYAFKKREGFGIQAAKNQVGHQTGRYQ